jgi:hypothetical protein
MISFAATQVAGANPNFPSQCSEWAATLKMRLDRFERVARHAPDLARTAAHFSR